MKIELEQYLYKKYPVLFSNVGKPMSESLMYFGCDCGDGWVHLIDSLCERITKYIANQHRHVDFYESENQSNPKWAKEKIEPVVFDQVKETFGRLRIYYSGGKNDTIKEMFDFAEHLSAYICEKCGKFDVTVGVVTKGHIRSNCKDCIGNNTENWVLINPELEKLL